jgi:hypothetical protein
VKKQYISIYNMILECFINALYEAMSRRFRLELRVWFLSIGLYEHSCFHQAFGKGRPPTEIIHMNGWFYGPVFPLRYWFYDSLFEQSSQEK